MYYTCTQRSFRRSDYKRKTERNTVKLYRRDHLELTGLCYENCNYIRMVVATEHCIFLKKLQVQASGAPLDQIAMC